MIHKRRRTATAEQYNTFFSYMHAVIITHPCQPPSFPASKPRRHAGRGGHLDLENSRLVEGSSCSRWFFPAGSFLAPPPPLAAKECRCGLARRLLAGWLPPRQHYMYAAAVPFCPRRSLRHRRWKEAVDCKLLGLFFSVARFVWRAAVAMPGPVSVRVSVCVSVCVSVSICVYVSVCACVSAHVSVTVSICVSMMPVSVSVSVSVSLSMTVYMSAGRHIAISCVWVLGNILGDGLKIPGNILNAILPRERG